MGRRRVAQKEKSAAVDRTIELCTRGAGEAAYALNTEDSRQGDLCLPLPGTETRKRPDHHGCVDDTLRKMGDQDGERRGGLSGAGHREISGIGRRQRMKHRVTLMGQEVALLAVPTRLLESLENRRLVEGREPLALFVQAEVIPRRSLGAFKAAHPLDITLDRLIRKVAGRRYSITPAAKLLCNLDDKIVTRSSA